MLKPLRVTLSLGLKKVSWRQKIDGFCCSSIMDISSNYGFKPRQFHCMILCLKFIGDKKDKMNKTSKKMETFMLYMY